MALSLIQMKSAMNLLSIKIGSVEFNNSVFVASGTFGYGQEAAELVDLNDIGAIVTKSVSVKPRIGNPHPRLYETGTGGMLNSIGLQNVGVANFIEEKLPFLRKFSTSIIVNIAGRTIDEFERVVEILEDQAGIVGYELNFSCPNVKEGGLEFSQDAKVTVVATQKIRKRTKRLVIPKLTPNITKISEIAQAAQDGGADAVSLINTVKGMAINIDNWQPRINTIVGGYSGPAIKPIALAKVYETAQTVTIPIIAIGGIRNWKDAIEFHLAGAVAIQIGTANFVDPSTASKVVQGLNDYLSSKKINNIDELRGKLKTA